MRRWLEAQDAGILPSSDLPAQLTTLASAAMAFVAAIVLALALSATRTADRWEVAFEAGMTVEMAFDTPPARAQEVVSRLADLPGILDARALTVDEQTALLRPWLGEDFDVSALRLPVLVAIEGSRVEPVAVRRVVGEVAPEARVIDHADWRGPVVTAARRIGWVAISALALTLLVAGTVVWLAASASVAASSRVIEVLRLVGAEDRFVTSRFARPFSIRGATGAAVGCVAATLALVLVRLAGSIGPLTAGPVGGEWFWLLLIPVVSGALAWLAARFAVKRMLMRMR